MTTSNTTREMNVTNNDNDANRGNRIAFLVFAVIISCAALLAMEALDAYRAAFGGSASAPPAALFERTELDLGNVTAGEVLPIVFPVHNPGAQRLVLTPAGCANCPDGADLDSVIVPAGGRAEVVVTLDTGNRAGDVQRVVRYTTSDPVRPRIELVVKATVM